MFIIQNVAEKNIKAKEKEKLNNQLTVMSHIQSDFHAKLVDVFFYQKTYFIITELVQATFKDIISRATETLSESFCKYSVWCLTSAIRDLHKKHVIHRNVSTSNLLVAPETALLNNMQDAIFLVSDKNMRESIVGEEVFASPELLDPQRSYDQSTDIWSLGMFSLVLVCGQNRITKQDLLSSDSANSKISEMLDIVRDKGMS